MKTTQVSRARKFILLGIPVVSALSALFEGDARPVEAASTLTIPPGRQVRPIPKAAIHQSASPEEQHPSTRVTPNLDWSIFLPAGDGQFQVSVYCTVCHSAQVIVTRRSDAAGWEQIVNRMINMHSAPVQPEDAAIITKYLGQVLTPSSPVLNPPIHINTASPEELKFLGLLSPENIQKIVDTRSKAKIKDFAALQTLTGDKNIEKYKDVLAFD